LFLLGVGESMVLVVSLLVEPFATIFADERLDSLMYPHVGVESRRAVKGLPTRATNVRFFRRVDDLVAAERRCLTKSFITYLHATMHSAQLIFVIIFDHQYGMENAKSGNNHRRMHPGSGGSSCSPTKLLGKHAAAPFFCNL